MNDGKVAKKPDDDVVLTNTAHRGAAADLGNESGTPDQRSVRVGIKEVFVEIGLAIRDHSPFPRTLLFGLANDYIGYVPTVGQSREWGYEVVASRVTPEASLFLEREAGILLDELYDLEASGG